MKANHIFSVWLAAAMFSVPFVVSYHITPIPSFYNEIVAFGLGLLALYPLLTKAAWQEVIIPKVVVWIFLIPLIVVQCYLDLIPTRSQALIYTCYLLWALLLMQLGSIHQRQFNSEEIYRRLASLIVLAAWFNVFYVGLQYLHKTGVYKPSFLMADTYGAISQTNHFASFVAIALVSLIYLFYTRPDSDDERRGGIQVSSVHFYAGLVAFMLLLSFSGSRSGWIYLGIMLVLSIWWSFKHPSEKLRTISRKVSLIVLLLLPTFSLMQFLISLYSHGEVLVAADRLGELADTQTVGGLKARLYMWHQSLQLFLSHPWLGIGLAQTAWATYSRLDEALPKGIDGVYENPHNLVVQLLSEVGIIGAIIVILPLLMWLKSVIRKPESASNWWLLAVLGILMTHAMLEYPMNYAYYLGLFAYLIGFAQISTWRLEINNIGKRTLQYGLAGLTALGMLVTIHTFSAYHKLDDWVRILMRNQFTAQSMDPYYETVSWMNRKSLLAAYSYPMFLLAIEYLPVDAAGKQAVNEFSLRVLPMPKSAYLQALYLLQQNKDEQALLAMKLALQAFPMDYNRRLSSVPDKDMERYQALYHAANQELRPASN